MGCGIEVYEFVGLSLVSVVVDLVDLRGLASPGFVD